MRDQLGGGCLVVVRPPFVLGGDSNAATLERTYSVTIEPARQAMAHCYFARTPNKPTTLLLFSNDSTYRRFAERLFFDRDISRFGYYKPGRNTVVVNLQWGDGPLLHELTHALMEFDFPDASAWLSEGLASLHEASHIRRRDQGSILEGRVNWRLNVLKGRMRVGRLPPFERLTEIPNLNDDAAAVNFAQARYFCMFLQRKGVLAEVYRRYRAGRREDPRGQRAVLAMFPGHTWDDLDAEFRAWVMSLPDP